MFVMGFGGGDVITDHNNYKLRIIKIPEGINVSRFGPLFPTDFIRLHNLSSFAELSLHYISTITSKCRPR